MFRNYLTTAWRNIKKHPGFSFINAGGLVIGLASCMLLLLYVSYHLNFDKHFNNLDNIYIVENNQPGNGQVYTFASAPRLAAASIKAEVPGVTRAVRVVDYSADGLISYNDNNFRKDGMYADAGFFSVFSYHFISGDPVKALLLPNSIVITKELAETVFGTEDPMNKIITRNDKQPLVVTGVIDPMPANTTFKFDYMLPWAIFEETNPWAKNAGWGSNFCRVYVQLKDASYLENANKLMGPLIGKHSEGNENRLFLFPFSGLHLYSKFENGKSVGGLIEQIRLFELLAVVILLIACVNFMNLSTARSEKRAKEVGIRKAIGSDRKSLVIQFITESLLLSFISTITAVFVVIISLPFFNQLLNIKLELPFDDMYTLAVVAGLAVITGLVSGSYPAFYLSSFKPVKVLKGLFKGDRSTLSVRKILVIIQFSFAVFLISATICIYRQIRFVQDRPIGYEQDGLLEIPVEGELAKKSSLLISVLQNSGAIISGTEVSQSINQTGNNTWGIKWPGKRDDQTTLFDIFGTGYDFVRTAGAKLIAGREFSKEFPADSAGKTVMINETAARLMNLKEPVGTMIWWGDEPFTIIGICKDFILGSPYNKTPPMISPFVKGTGAVALVLRLNPGKSLSYSMDKVKAALKSINPAYPPEIRFTQGDFEEKFQNERLLATLANLFGGLAIVISCLGLFGLAAYSAEQRIKEIGVRKVLGAGMMNLAALLSTDFIKLVAIAIVIAIPVSVWMLDRWLDNYEFRIGLSWWFFALSGFITIVIAILTVSYQAIKTSMANPVKSLRSE